MKNDRPQFSQEITEEAGVACDRIEAALGPIASPYRAAYADALMQRKAAGGADASEMNELPVTDVAQIIERSQALRKNPLFDPDVIFVQETENIVVYRKASDPEGLDRMKAKRRSLHFSHGLPHGLDVSGSMSPIPEKDKMETGRVLANLPGLASSSKGTVLMPAIASVTKVIQPPSATKEQNAKIVIE